MKYLAFILSVYLLVLNLVPCEDYAVADNEVNTEISQSIDVDHQHQGTDICSPFCICQCCHISATHFKIADLKLDITYISTQDFFYLNGLAQDFSFSVLQPPQA
jgi:hypothetical protein